jgi:hypothetical protein
MWRSLIIGHHTGYFQNCHQLFFLASSLDGGKALESLLSLAIPPPSSDLWLGAMMHQSRRSSILGHFKINFPGFMKIAVAQFLM